MPAAKTLKREEQQREEGARWDADRKRRDATLWRRRLRGPDTQFPTMHACIEEPYLREERLRLRKASQQARDGMRQRNHHWPVGTATSRPRRRSRQRGSRRAFRSVEAWMDTASRRGTRVPCSCGPRRRFRPLTKQEDPPQDS